MYTQYSKILFDLFTVIMYGIVCTVKENYCAAVMRLSKRIFNIFFLYKILYPFFLPLFHLKLK